MAILDELSGYEFEDQMEDVFRHLGFENVRVSERSADKGRDILMEEVVDGERRAVVVECKHTETVSRPVVQKLHSAVATYDYDGPKRGMVATSGRFTGPAQEYADALGTNCDGGMELLGGSDLREIGEEIGMDLYNGRIEILCEQALEPIHPTAGHNAPLYEASREVENLEPSALPSPKTTVDLEPIVTVSSRTRATFETSVGVIHSLDERNELVIHANRGRPRVASEAVRKLATNQSAARVDLEGATLETQFDAVSRERFGQTETEYKAFAVESLQQRHTKTVHYTGDNNVDYQRTCTPTQSDIHVRDIESVYLPQVHTEFSLGEYGYAYDYYTAGDARATTANDLHQCVHCGAANGTHTFCDNCGSINCEDHIETERLEDEPVCTGCAVTERFALQTKYFYDEDNLERFREEYDEMPIHEKARENIPLAVGAVLASLFLTFVVLSGVGVI